MKNKTAIKISSLLLVGIIIYVLFGIYDFGHYLISRQESKTALEEINKNFSIQQYVLLGLESNKI